MKVLPTKCPACNEQLKVRSLICQQCDTDIQGQYELPLLARLSPDDQIFALEFIKTSGSLKKMEKLLKLSYPTVRNRLDEIIEHIRTAEAFQQNSKEENK